MTTLKDAVRAYAYVLRANPQADSYDLALAGIIQFLQHPAVRKPSEAMVRATKLRRGAVKPVWQAMLDQLVKELRDV